MSDNQHELYEALVASHQGLADEPSLTRFRRAKQDEGEYSELQFDE